MLVRKKILAVLFTTILCFVWSNSFAQIDLYAKINDPLGIAKLDNVDSTHLRYVNFHGFSGERDPSDGFFVIAKDSGAGVLTHLWITYGNGDSLAIMKLYLDGVLIVGGRLDSVMGKSHGTLRPPLDTLYPGAYVCDVQLPYKKNFRITFTAPTDNMYCAIGWRPIADSAILPKFSLFPTLSGQAKQIKAEQRLRNCNDPWQDSTSALAVFADSINPHQQSTVLDLKGPAVIRTLHINLDRYDVCSLDSLWLVAYWDNSPYPAIEVPIGDFFCTTPNSIPINSLELQWNPQSGFTSLFPMPFSSNARIVLENRSSMPVKATSLIAFHREPIDKSILGYFYTAFSETNPTRFNVNHRVIHTLGKGRYVGMFQYIPNNHSGVSLEGDPIFTIDSNRNYSFRYTGGEDYFDGGWWFFGKMFSLPFAGHTKFFEAFYRFHILDAVEFKSSFDFDLQHGIRSDVREHYRTTAYYYKQTVPFWTSRDTIRKGEYWMISGAGYTPNTSITARFDNEDVIFTTKTNARGEFAATLQVPTSWKAGRHSISINDEVRPEPIYILHSPSIHPVTDFLPPVVKYRDILRVDGNGFIPNERITLYLDSIRVSDPKDTIIVNNHYQFSGIAHIPNIKDWKYHLVAQGDSGSRAVCSELVTVKRNLTYEFEDLIPLSYQDGGNAYERNLSMNYYATWSQQEIAQFEPDRIGRSITFKYYVPVSDTFDVALILTKGKDFGLYAYWLDGIQLGRYDGYAKLDPFWFDPRPSDTLHLGQIFFAKDTHTILLNCVGKNTDANGLLAGADVLLLTARTTMPFPQGLWKDTIASLDTSSVNHSNPQISSNGSTSIMLYANPVTDGMLHGELTTKWVDANITVTDILGRTIFSRKYSGSELGMFFSIDLKPITQGKYFLQLDGLTSIGLRHITAPFIVVD